MGSRHLIVALILILVVVVLIDMFDFDQARRPAQVETISSTICLDWPVTANAAASVKPG